MSAASTGSSPLTRGKRRVASLLLALTGLIPAHAGKTSVMSSGASGRPAHPRSRGENSIEETTGALASGSSPLTRGKRSPLPRPLRRLRLIPAHAGKTRPILGGLFTDGAHPRSRGENLLAQRQEHMAAGSSPLTRGKRIGESVAHATARLIPAHAGKTTCARGSTSRPSAHPRSRGENLVAAIFAPF